MLNKLKISRRMALRGVVAGTQVAMWLPVLNAMTDDNGEAFAQGGALPTSFGIWFWGNGHRPEDWNVEGTGQGNAWSLPDHLSAFQPVKDKINFLSGLNMLDGDFRGHGAGTPYVLCGGYDQPGRAPTAARATTFEPYGFEKRNSTHNLPTLDQVVADHFENAGPPSPFKSIETGTMPFRGNIAMGTMGQDLAHRGPNEVLSAERDPAQLFNRLFSGGDLPTAPEAIERSPAVLSRMRRSALDAVQGEVQRLSQQVGAVDAARLDSHLTSIRAIEARLATLAEPTPQAGGGGCALPQQPGRINVEDANTVTERSETMNRLVVTALSCNLTRVYSHFWSGPRSDNTYPQSNVDGEHHALTHGNAAAQQRASNIVRYIIAHYADLLQVMDETPMGAGTVLDNTVNWGCTEQANPRDHRHSGYRLFVCGGGGGKLTTGQHLDMDGRKITEVHLTMLRALGLPLERWGAWDNTDRTVSQILT